MIRRFLIAQKKGGCVMRRKTLFVPIGLISFFAVTGGSGLAAEKTPPPTPDPSAVRYGIPADQPEGSVSLLSFGVESLTTSPGTTRNYLHVRIIVENRGGSSTWKVLASNQSMRDRDLLFQPAYAVSSTDNVSLSVPTGQKGWLDLFFLVNRETAPIAFMVDWTVDTGNSIEHQATAFGRESGAMPAYYGPRTSQDSQFVPVGSSWWYMSAPWVSMPMEAEMSFAHLYRVAQRPYLWLPPLVIQASEVKPGVAKSCPGC
jgi:hypothetical protein